MLSGIRTILLSSTRPPFRSYDVISKMDYISDDEIKQHPPVLRRVKRNIREQNPRVIRGSFHVRAVSALLSLRSAVADIPSEKSTQQLASSLGGSFWRRRWDSNPRYLAVHRISSAARYDHFDTSPCARISITEIASLRNHYFSAYSCFAAPVL